MDHTRLPPFLLYNHHTNNEKLVSQHLPSIHLFNFSVQKYWVQIVNPHLNGQELCQVAQWLCTVPFAFGLKVSTHLKLLKSAFCPLTPFSEVSTFIIQLD